MGAAIAVLALYILVLLAPLHQAAGLQRDLDALNYVALDTLSVCAPPMQDGDGQPATVKCAAAGIGNNEPAAIAPAAIEVGIVRIAGNVHYWLARPDIASSFDRLPGNPRAPPAIV